MPAHPLTIDDREAIRVGIAENLPDGEIGRQLRRCRTTINREINRNGGRARYSAAAAQRRADQARRRPKVSKLVADPGLADAVIKGLEDLDSPMRISIELAAKGRRVSHECIYQAIYNKVLPAGIHANLHLRRRRRKRRKQADPGGHSLGQFNHISTRPKAADDRSEIGHLEGDLIVGASNGSALITVADRYSRYGWLSEVANKTAAALKPALIALLERIPPQLRLTLTWDQGSEIAQWQQIELATGIAIYITDPKSPWQRPTNENYNAHVRRHVGKGTNLNIYTPDDLRRIEHRINTIPRRIHNWATAHHIYTQAVAMTL